MTANQVLDVLENGPVGDETALPLPVFVPNQDLAAESVPEVIDNDDDVLPLPRWEPANVPAVRGVRGHRVSGVTVCGETALEIPRFVTAAELEE